MVIVVLITACSALYRVMEQEARLANGLLIPACPCHKPFLDK